VDKLFALRLKPNARLLGIIINAYVQTDNFEKIEQLLDVSCQFGLALENSSFETILRFCQKHGRWKEFRHAVDYMHRLNITPDIDIFNALLIGYDAQSDLENMDKIYEQMKVLGLNLTHKVYSIMIAFYARMGEIDKMKKIYGETLKNHIRPSVDMYRIVVGSLGKVGDLNAMEQVVGDMRLLGIHQDPSTENFILQAYCKEV
jgi:pentatricopeptide repeat protein